MIKSGKGGGNTRTGLVFEGKTDLSKFLESQPHYSVVGHDVFYDTEKVAEVYKKHNFYSIFLKKLDIDWKMYLSKQLLPDDCTVRDYVDQLQNYFDGTDDIYKGEDDGEDLSKLSEDAIWSQLKDRIYDSTLTIVMISPNMKSFSPEREQWIPWEISYSLKEVSRKNKAGNMVTSSSNAILAIVLPNRSGSYAYFLEDKNCCATGCRSLKTNTLFSILKKNMFNIKKPDKKICTNFEEIYHGDSSYIYSVKWKDFIANPSDYIEKAYHLQNSIEQYDIYKEVD